MKRLIRRVLNLLWYQRWTDCAHGRWPDDWRPVSFADWECRNCGVRR